MLRVFWTIVLVASLSTFCDDACSAKKKVIKKTTTKKRQYVDLEGLDITGLIDRPRTLYIIKKSDIDFRDNFADYDYTKAIVEVTYNEPF